MCLYYYYYYFFALINVHQGSAHPHALIWQIQFSVGFEQVQFIPTEITLILLHTVDFLKCAHVHCNPLTVCIEKITDWGCL